MLVRTGRGIGQGQMLTSQTELNIGTSHLGRKVHPLLLVTLASEPPTLHELYIGRALFRTSSHGVVRTHVRRTCHTSSLHSEN